MSWYGQVMEVGLCQYVKFLKELGSFSQKSKIKNKKSRIRELSALNMISSVTYYLELRYAIYIYLFYISFSYQKLLNWLFGHYRTSTT